MALLTVEQVREHVETDLVSDALQRLIDDADGEIIARLGALAAATEVLQGGGTFIHLARRASAVTSATERIDDADYPLVAADYELLADGFRVQRKQAGDEPSLRWRGRVTVAYTPESDQASRVRLLVDLVKLAVAYTGDGGSSVGDVRVSTIGDYQAERERLFAALLNRGRRRLA